MLSPADSRALGPLILFAICMVLLGGLLHWRDALELTGLHRKFLLLTAPQDELSERRRVW